MATTYNAIFLGKYGQDIDPQEGDSVSDNSAQLVGMEFGDPSNPLSAQIVRMTTVDNGGTDHAIDIDNAASQDDSRHSSHQGARHSSRDDRDHGSHDDDDHDSRDDRDHAANDDDDDDHDDHDDHDDDHDSQDKIQFDLGDGAGPQSVALDGLGVYSATLTYWDGTTADISAVVTQDVNGNLFLQPEMTANSDSDAMEAAPIASLSLNHLITNNAVLADSRHDTRFVCFVSGTRIDTPDGPRAVETLRVGDLVRTADHGNKQIRWIGGRSLRPPPRARPIHFPAGVLGHGLPERDLMVSPQHRMLVRSPVAARMFGADEVLLPAVRFLRLHGVRRVEGSMRVTYWHIMFDAHEIIFAEGAAAESLLLGPEARTTMGLAALAELADIFPDLIGAQAQTPPPSARPIPERGDQRQFINRLARNGRAIDDRRV